MLSIMSSKEIVHGFRNAVNDVHNLMHSCSFPTKLLYWSAWHVPHVRDKRTCVTSASLPEDLYFNDTSWQGIFVAAPVEYRMLAEIEYLTGS